MRKSALLVMQNGGVVRRLRNFDEQELAYKIRKDHDWFRRGRHWTMEFDARPQVITQLNQELKLDPIVIRHGCVRVARKLSEKVQAEADTAESLQVATQMKTAQPATGSH